MDTMFVLCFIAAIAAAAFGVWWLTVMLTVAGLVLGSIEAFDARDRHLSQLRRRQLDDLIEQQKQGTP